jgi:hypothetical protein
VISAIYHLLQMLTRCVYSRIVFNTVDLAKLAGIMLHIAYYCYYYCDEYTYVCIIAKKKPQNYPHR